MCFRSGNREDRSINRFDELEIKAKQRVNNHIILKMSQSVNAKTVVPRMSHATAQPQLNMRPKPRGSEPPMHSAHIDKSTESSKTAKSKESISKYPSKLYKPQTPSRVDLNQRVLIPQMKEKNSLEKNSGSLNKLGQISSPKAGGLSKVLSKTKTSNNTSMPGPSTATSKLVKPSNMIKVDSSSNLSNKSASSINMKKTTVPQSPQEIKIPSFQQVSKMPRFSDLGLMPSDDQDEPVVKNGKVVTNGSKPAVKPKEAKSSSKDSKALSKDSKKSSASNDSKVIGGSKMASNTSKLMLNTSVNSKAVTNSKSTSKNLSAEGAKLITSNKSNISHEGKIISNNSSKNQKGISGNSSKNDKIISNNSSKNEKILSNNSVKSTKEFKSGTKTLNNLSSDKQGFKKKDPLISKNSSSIEPKNFEPKFLRQSGFKQSDFLRINELGSGKFGKVHLVRHNTTGFVCAMKTVPKALLKGQNIVNQFIRQIKIQSCLCHPNIAKLYGFFDDQQNIYLLMELGTEGQLYTIMKDKIKFNEATAIYIIRQLCEAVKYLHGLHILHRDIKPENLVITYGAIKLCDFGWAVCKGSQLRSTFCGTPLYVSPQILKGQQYDQKIDVWAIGILTYELLIGDIPFQIQSEQELVKIIKEEIVFPTEIQLTTEAKDFIMKILQKNPEDRLKIQKLLQHPFLRRHVDSSDIQL